MVAAVVAKRASDLKSMEGEVGERKQTLHSVLRGLAMCNSLRLHRDGSCSEGGGVE